MAIIILSALMPDTSAVAEMIGTSTILENTRLQQTRNQLKHLLMRGDVIKQLSDRGFNPHEAYARIDGLTDNELKRIAAQLEELPAGGNGFLLSGGAWGIVGIAIIVAVIVLFTTDLLGYTDFFNIR